VVVADGAAAVCQAFVVVVAVSEALLLAAVWKALSSEVAGAVAAAVWKVLFSVVMREA